MPVLDLPTLDDPRLDPYRSLRGNNQTRDQGLFIAEGPAVVRRLFDSAFTTRSVLVADKKYASLAPHLPNDVDVFRLPHALAQQLVGYSFHAGVLACGERRTRRAVAELEGPGAGERALILVGTQITDPENVGAMTRIAAGFGADAVVFGPHSADPFSRRALRVGIGAALFVPVVESDDLERDLAELRERGCTLVAVVAEANAEPLAQTCRELAHTPRIALVFGHETEGLAPRFQALCARRTTIPMAAAADSLNVAVATGIVVHAMRERGAGSGLEPEQPGA